MPDSINDLITFVVISETPVTKIAATNSTFINEVYKKSDLDSRHNAFINAAKRVKTPFIMFVNKTDIISSELIFPPDNSGISYGDLMFKEAWGFKTNPTGLFEKQKNLENPYNVRRAILRTEYVESVLSATRDRGLDTETILYYLIALLYGHTYNQKFKAVWDKTSDKLFVDNLYSIKQKTIDYLKANSFKLRFKIEEERLRLDKESLSDIEECKELLTIVTISKKEYKHPNLFGLTYINHLSDNKNNIELFLSLKTILRKVKTPFVLFIDEGSPIPERIQLPSKDTGLTYGDIFIKTGETLNRIKSKKFSSEVFLKNTSIIFNPIYRTEAVRKIIEKLDVTDINPFTVLNYYTASVFGSEYNNKLIIVWDKTKELSLDKVQIAETPLAVLNEYFKTGEQSFLKLFS